MAKVIEEPEIPQSDADYEGKTFLFQEAQGIIIGTVRKMGPMTIFLGADSVLVRDTGNIQDAVRNGTIPDLRKIPYLEIERMALRFKAPWNHKIPG